MRRPIRLLIALLIILSAVPVRAQKPVVIFASDARPPESWLEGGRARGIHIDILHELERRTGLVFDIRTMPWARAYAQALEGRGGVIGLAANRDRLKIFDYSGLTSYDELRLVVLKGREFRYNAMKDLKGKTVGITRGASYGDAFNEAKTSIFTPSEDPDPVCRLRMLLAGRIDAALIGPGKSAVRFVINEDKTLQDNRDQFVILETPFSRPPNFIGFHKKLHQTETLEKINRALDAMWWDSTIQRITSRY